MPHGLHRGLDGAVGGHDDDLGLRGRALHGLEQLHPVQGRHAQVGEDHVVGALGELLERAGAVGGLAHLVPRLAQEHGGGGAHVLLVVHHQHVAGRRREARALARVGRAWSGRILGSDIGRSQPIPPSDSMLRRGPPGPGATTAPARPARAGPPGTGAARWCRRPGRMETEISPPWPSTIRFTTARPRPVPVALVVKNGSKMRVRISAGMPGPVSSTSSSTPPASAADAHAQPAAAGHGLDRVDGHVEHRLPDQPRVHGHRGKVGAHVDAPPPPRLAPSAQRGRHRLVHHAGPGAPAGAPGVTGRAKSRRSPDDAVEPVCLLAHDVEQHPGVALAAGAAAGASPAS